MTELKELRKLNIKQQSDEVTEVENKNIVAVVSQKKEAFKEFGVTKAPYRIVQFYYYGRGIEIDYKAELLGLKDQLVLKMISHRI